MSAACLLVSILGDLSQKVQCSFYWWKETLATFFGVVLVARLATRGLAHHHRGMNFDWKLSLHHSKRWIHLSFGLVSSSSPSTRKTATVLSSGLVWRTLCLQLRKAATKIEFDLRALDGLPYPLCFAKRIYKLWFERLYSLRKWHTPLWMKVPRMQLQALYQSAMQ